MTFLNASLLFGLVAVAVPIVLHFLLRQKPKRFLFPALRLLEQRKRQTVRRLRLKHLWLLLLRILVIALLVIALARPALPAADYSLAWSEVAALVVIALVALGAYALAARRIVQPRDPPHVAQEKRAKTAGWIGAAALLLALLLVGWPYQRRIAAALASPAPSGEINLPVAGLFLFDVSQSMEYLQEGQTRLDSARRLASEHLEELPTGSKIGVADNGRRRPILFQPSLDGVAAQMERLKLSAGAAPLEDRLLDCLGVHEDDRLRVLDDQSNLPEESRRARYIRRIYVFTDMAASAWRSRVSAQLKSELERLDYVNVYLVDVSVEEPFNRRLRDLNLSSTRVVQNGNLTVSANISAGGRDINEQLVELQLRNDSGELVKVGQATVSVPNGSTQSVALTSRVRRESPYVHGELRLASTDPLEIDDVRYFTIEMQQPTRVLLVADNEDDVYEWRAAIEAVETGAFRTAYRPTVQLSDVDLSQYEIVLLINARQPTDGAWQGLRRFVATGGGLGVFLGDLDLSVPSYQGAEATKLLPAVPDFPVKMVGRSVARMEFASTRHPLLDRLDQFDMVTLLEVVDIYRYWKTLPQPDGTVLARYDDDDDPPALLARHIENGRVVMFTSGVDLKTPRHRWNNLPNLPGAPWVFPVFADQVMRYLNSEDEQRLNFWATETPRISLAAAETGGEREFRLRKPQITTERVTAPAEAARLEFPTADVPGRYDLADAGSGKAVAGFSVNLDDAETDLSKLSRSALDEKLGAGRYQVAESLDELSDNIEIADLGREAFPLVLLFMIGIFAGELFVSNRFYRE